MLKVSASDFKAHCLQYMALTQNKHDANSNAKCNSMNKIVVK